ncbi:MAG: hypothetical protein JRI72_00055 [Deltaproteobacteria bacterium]|nr:hypothetical protein [Deltaproteobacteria bacterium]
MAEYLTPLERRRSKKIEVKEEKTTIEYLTPLERRRLQEEQEPSPEQEITIEPTRDRSTLQKLITPFEFPKTIFSYFQREAEKPIEQKQEEMKEFARTPTGAFGYGLTGGVSKFLLPGERGRELFDIARESRPGAYTAGNIAGTVSKYATLYNLAGPAIEKAVSPITGKIGSGFLKELAVEGAKDIAIGGPLGIADALSEGLPAKDIPKEAAKNLLFDTAANAAFYGLGKGLKALSENMRSPNAIKNMTQLNEVSKPQSLTQRINNAIKQQENVIDDLTYRKYEYGLNFDDSIKIANDYLEMLQDYKKSADALPFAKKHLDTLEKKQMDLFNSGKSLTPEFANISQNISKLKNRINELELIEKTIPSQLTGIEQINKTVINAAEQTNKNTESFMKKINYDPKKPKASFREKWTKAREQFIDRFAELEELEKRVKGKIPSAEKSLYKQARLFQGVPERANRIVDADLRPIIKSVEDAGYNYRQLGAYAEAVHAKDVNAAGLQSGFTDAEIDDVIKSFGSPEMEEARKQLVNYNNNLLAKLVETQVINPTEATAMMRKWPNYMPLSRSFDDAKVELGKGLRQSFANIGKPIKKLKGSEREIVDPIESMVRNTFQIENVAGRSRVGLELGEIAKADVEHQFVRRLEPGEAVGRKNVVNIYEFGEKVQYEVEPGVYKAMLSLNSEMSPLWIKALSKPASLLRAGATLTAEFAIRNPIRDVLNAFIVSSSGFTPLDFVAGLASYIKKGELYDKFLRANAGYGNIISMDRTLHRETLEKIVKQPPSKKFINVLNPKSWLAVMRNIADATESATKIGEFGAALRKGATVEEAAYRARDLMDFARAGSSVKELNKVVAFLNANIQGKSKLIRAIKEDPIKVSAKLFSTMTASSLGAYAAYHYLANENQKATIDDAPDWLRDTFWLIPVPDTDIVARIPKPFDVAFVSNVMERFLRFALKEDKDAFDGFIKATVKEQSIPTMFTGILPIIEGLTNYSFFRETQIIPQREQYYPRRFQADVYTSEAAKAAAGLVEKTFGEETPFSSPRIMENTILGLTGGLGRYGLNAIDIILGDMDKPSLNVSQYPLLRAFTVNETATGRSMDFVYSEMDRLRRLKNEAKLTKSRFLETAQYNYLNNITNKVGELSKRIRQIQESKIYSKDAKRDKINKLKAERNELVRKAEKTYKDKWID